jgi:ATP-binding cassette subfamily F protein 3
VVSHDRNFIRKIANKIWYIENYQIKEFLGTYDEYEIWQEERKQNTSSEPQNHRKEKEKEKNKPLVGNEIQKNQKQQQKQLETLEARIIALEAEKKSLEEQLANPDLYQQPELFEQIHKQYKNIETELAQQLQAWEMLIG